MGETRFPHEKVCPVPVLQWASVRLRSLTEAECYARCYGGRREEAVSFVRVLDPSGVEESVSTERLRELVEHAALEESGRGREAA